MALASITETYTDSEGEDDKSDASSFSPSPSSSPIKSNSGTPGSSGTPAKQSTPSRKARLVSYQDEEAVVSDAEVEETKTEPPAVEEVVEKEVVPDELVTDNIEIPIEPSKPCLKELNDKVIRMKDKTLHGLDMNLEIQSRKSFRNPSIYEKLIQFCAIDELGTNYPIAMYDPHQWDETSHYEELAKIQKAEMDRREKERKEKTKVEFVSGTAKKGTTELASAEEAKRRKSKWDQVGQNNPVAPIRVAGLIQPPTLTTAVTGTKGTVIQAFGMLNKRPKI